MVYISSFIYTRNYAKVFLNWVGVNTKVFILLILH